MMDRHQDADGHWARCGGQGGRAELPRPPQVPLPPGNCSVQPCKLLWGFRGALSCGHNMPWRWLLVTNSTFSPLLPGGWGGAAGPHARTPPWSSQQTARPETPRPCLAAALLPGGSRSGRQGSPLYLCFGGGGSDPRLLCLGKSATTDLATHSQDQCHNATIKKA